MLQNVCKFCLYTVIQHLCCKALMRINKNTVAIVCKLQCAAYCTVCLLYYKLTVYVCFTIAIPQITTLSVVERCVSYLFITWNDTSQCVPVSYTVMLTNTSSGELLHNDIASSNYYNFTGLTSDMAYTITVTGRNRVGQDVVMVHTSSLKSDGKVVSLSV